MMHASLHHGAFPLSPECFCLTDVARDIPQVRVEVNGEYIVGVAAGEHHTLVVTRHGDVYSSGRGKEGQLGHGEEFRLDEDLPRKVTRPMDDSSTNARVDHVATLNIRQGAETLCKCCFSLSPKSVRVADAPGHAIYASREPGDGVVLSCRN